MDGLCQFIQNHSKYITLIALVLALLGTVLLAWDYIQWSDIKRAKFNQEYGVVIAMTENIAKQKWGSIFIGCSIIIQLVVELCKRT